MTGRWSRLRPHAVRITTPNRTTTKPLPIALSSSTSRLKMMYLVEDNPMLLWFEQILYFHSHTEFVISMCIHYICILMHAFDLDYVMDL